MRAEGVGGAEDRAEVAGVGDAVERDQQRRLEAVRGDLEQLVDLGVLVGRDHQRHTLVHRVVGHAIEVGAVASTTGSARAAARRMISRTRSSASIRTMRVS